MLLEAIETFKKLSGEIVKAGSVIDIPQEKVLGLIERKRIRLIPDETASQDTPSRCDQTAGHTTGAKEEGTGPKTQETGMSMIATWDSPLFGRLEAPLIDQGPTHFRLIHPLTKEVVTLSNEWLVSMDERSAILEYDGGLPREEADDQARTEFFGLFRRQL